MIIICRLCNLTIIILGLLFFIFLKTETAYIPYYATTCICITLKCYTEGQIWDFAWMIYGFTEFLSSSVWLPWYYSQLHSRPLSLIRLTFPYLCHCIQPDLCQLSLDTIRQFNFFTNRKSGSFQAAAWRSGDHQCCSSFTCRENFAEKLANAAKRCLKTCSIIHCLKCYKHFVIFAKVEYEIRWLSKLLAN